MSQDRKDPMPAEGPCVEAPCQGVERVLQSRERDLGGFSVRRLLPHSSQRMVGPWIFFDHMGPAVFPPGRGIDVRPHPHINLATVTYLFEGSVLHRDSLGNAVVIEPGDLNLMVAGSGIVHSERTPVDVRGGEHHLHGLQLWLALPAASEETEPEFLHYGKAALPAAERSGVALRVMIGAAFGLESPVAQFAATLYLEADVRAGAELELPPARERGLYLVSGRGSVAGASLEAASMAVLDDAAGLQFRAEQDSRVVLVGGDPVGPRHIFWNFVSSRRDRIEQAKADWSSGRFAKVPGDEEEFIPLPE